LRFTVGSIGLRVRGLGFRVKRFSGIGLRIYNSMALGRAIRAMFTSRFRSSATDSTMSASRRASSAAARTSPAVRSAAAAAAAAAADLSASTQPRRASCA
jgi:hypothetical protein